MRENDQEYWEMWYPQAAAAGLYFARCRVAPQESVIVHSPPPSLTVFVRDDQGQVKGSAQDLASTGDAPMARLTRTGDRIEREDIWPGPEDIGKIVLLPGGEAGILTEWWHAPDRSEWRWSVEFYNHK